MSTNGFVPRHVQGPLDKGGRLWAPPTSWSDFGQKSGEESSGEKWLLAASGLGS